MRLEDAGLNHVSRCATLQAENSRLKAEIERLTKRTEALSVDNGNVTSDARKSHCEESAPSQASSAFIWESNGHGLTKNDIERYSRQIILPCLGTSGQARLKAASVLVVGAGGLGAPVLLYLAAAGVGRLSIVDRDYVDASNLHRQVIHRESSVGACKTLSAAAAVTSLNSSIQVEAHVNGFTAKNAVRLAGDHDIVVDASDNAATRYLISDACCATGRPLVSGAALGLDGQLTVYHYGTDGPCYRCLFPSPPAVENCSRCSDAGVLGPIPGFIGCLQALETIKLIAGIGEPLSRRLLVVDGLSASFSSVKLRPRSPTCEACGESPSITAASIAAYDYPAFTGQPAHDAPPAVALLPQEERVTAAVLMERLAGGLRQGTQPPGGSGATPAPRPLTLLDVRPAEEFDMCHLPGSVSVPFDRLPGKLQDVRQLSQSNGSSSSLIVLCRRGNDSQAAVRLLRDSGISAVDLVDGLNSCCDIPLNAFPKY